MRLESERMCVARAPHTSEGWLIFVSYSDAIGISWLYMRMFKNRIVYSIEWRSYPRALSRVWPDRHVYILFERDFDVQGDIYMKRHLYLVILIQIILWWPSFVEYIYSQLVCVRYRVVRRSSVRANCPDQKACTFNAMDVNIHIDGQYWQVYA